MLTTAQEKLERIKLGIESGKTVYLTTYLKFWKYTPKIVLSDLKLFLSRYLVIPFMYNRASTGFVQMVVGL